MLVSVAAHGVLPQTGRLRTVYSTYQLLLGFLVLYLSQWWALLMVAPKDPSLGIRDLLVISGRLWNSAFQMLPQTRWPIYLGFWGLLLMVGAVTITGGLADWFHWPTTPKR